MSLLEIKEFLEVHDRGEQPCETIKVKLEEKLEEIEKKIQQLKVLKQELKGILFGWETVIEHPTETIYPIIEQV